MDPSHMPNIERKNINKEIFKLSLSLYNLSHISRKDVEVIINMFSDFFSEHFIPFLQNEVENHVKPISNEASYSKTQFLLESTKDVFREVSTEHLRFKLYEQNSLYIPPQLYEIGKDCHYIIDENQKSSVKMKTVYGAYVSLEDTLQKTLSIPGVLESIFNYMDELKKEEKYISNVLQADLWKKKYKDLGKNVLPLYLYFDEFETRNPLGSHAGEEKMGGVYVSLACLPPQICAKLRNVFVSAIFKSKYMKKFKIEQLFRKTLEDLKRLYTKGVKINIGGSEIVIFFQCIQILGDNLGLNTICGFSLSFMAKYCCRICSAAKEECQEMIEENEALLRTTKSYLEDLKKNNFEETGIKEECIFNQLENFDITENISGDFMHDGPEGNFNYSLSKILDGLISEKLITLEIINNRIENFPYNDLEKQNKPRLLFFSQGKAGKKKLKIKQSASEILCLTRYFGLMIGDLIPADNQYWKLYLVLRDIVDILTSPVVNRGQIQNIKMLIMKHNMQYFKLFGKLKPKMHIWLHYPRLILLNGPVIHYSSMKFERKNKELKEAALGTTSNINLPLTIAIKHQLKLCYTLEFCPPILNEVLLGPKINLDAHSYLKNLLPNLSSDIQVMALKKVEILGNDFSKGTVFVIRINDNGPAFGVIKNIFYVESKSIYFETEEFDTIYFNCQYHAYNVECDPSKPVLLINVELIPKIPPCLLCKKNDDDFVATRYSI